jgi:dolichyl N-acetyl-alpha-D-glucosaminyl phosphate 3-beta-D-2,3-diacetamido-2,3-dideoxy-beta-D-glucuronosyltransferase
LVLTNAPNSDNGSTGTNSLHMPIVVVGIHAFNKEKTIARAVLGAQKNSHVVIVCDDGSSDLTGEIALRLGAVVVNHERKLGTAAALQSLFKQAKKLNADVLVTLDCNGQHDPSEISILVKPIENGIADIVLGSRFKEKNCATDLSTSKKLDVKVISKLSKISNKKIVSDAQSNFRAYSKFAIEQIDSIFANNICPNIDIQTIQESGLSICEVPISFKYCEPESIDNFEPFVSIIIPTRNEENNIGRCLASFVTQTYPKNKFEIIIEDGLSNDRTLEIIQSYSKKLNLRVRSNWRVKHVFAFNDGIQEAEGDYFIIVSGHSFVDKDFIKLNVDAYHGIAKVEPKLAAVGGGLQMLSKTSFGELVACVFSSPFSGSSSFWRSKTSNFAKTVVFGFYNKRMVQQVGCFDQDMLKGQDFELNLRLRRAGFSLFCLPEIKPCYYVRQTFRGFLNQAIDNGAAKGLCVRKGYFNPIWFVPSAFAAYQVIMFGGLLLSVPWAIFLTGPFAVYWIINIITSIKVSNKKHKSVLLPFIFWSLHVSCGLGFIVGLCKKIIKPKIQGRNVNHIAFRHKLKSQKCS